MIEHKIDKSTFGDGPWQTEPDCIEWRYLGLACLILRNDMGALCGYVGLPPEHPWRASTVELDNIVDVHGGITYTNKCNGHICHVPRSGESDDVLWIGFDCAHSGDYIPSFGGRCGGVYRDLDYVRREVESLAQQAARALP